MLDINLLLQAGPVRMYLRGPREAGHANCAVSPLPSPVFITHPMGCVFLIGMTCRLWWADCAGIRSVWVFRAISGVTDRGTCWSVTVMAGVWGGIGDGALLPGPVVPGRFPEAWRKSFTAGTGGGAAVAVTLSVAVRQVRDDGTEVPADGEMAAALADSAEQFAGLLAWAAGESGFLDHGEREDVIGTEGRELQRRLLQATFAPDTPREERIPQVASAAGRPHGRVEAG